MNATANSTDVLPLGPVERPPAPRRSLDEIAEEINLLHVQAGEGYAEALTLARSSVEHARRAGTLLQEAKDRITWGEWLPWLNGKCSLSERTAQSYMKIARDWSKLTAGPNPLPVADLGLREVLALLADPKPKKALRPVTPSPEARPATEPSAISTAPADSYAVEVKVHLTVAGREKLERQVAELERLFRTTNRSDTIAAIVDRGHQEWLG